MEKEGPGKKLREGNSIKSRKHNSGRKKTVTTPAMIEEGKRKLDEQSSAKPNDFQITDISS